MAETGKPSSNPSTASSTAKISGDAYPVRGRYVHAHDAVSGAVLQNSLTGKVVALNETGVIIWGSITGQSNINSICDSILEIYEVDREELKRQVATLIMNLVASGMIALQRIPAIPARWTSFESLVIEFRETSLMICTDVSEISEWIRKRYEALLVNKSRFSSGEPVIVSELEGRLHIEGKYVQNPLVSTTILALEEIEAELSNRIAAQHPEYLWIRSSAAATGNQAILITGRPGSGKTSIVTAMTDIGWNFVSDLITPLDFAATSVIQFPIKPSIRVFDSVLEENPERPGMNREFREVDIDPAPQSAIPIGIVVVAVYSPHEPSRLEPMAHSEAVVMIAEQALNVRFNSEYVVRNLARILKDLVVLQLTYRDTEEAARILDNYRAHGA
jgi:Coenzyme PQQ synthesis protein D (PqqD)